MAKLWVGMTVNGTPITRTQHVVFNPEDEDLDAMDSVVKTLPDNVLKFLDDFPAVPIKAILVQPVNTTNFDAAVEQQSQENKTNSWEIVLQDIVKDAATAAIKKIVKEM